MKGPEYMTTKSGKLQRSKVTTLTTSRDLLVLSNDSSRRAGISEKCWPKFGTNHILRITTFGQVT